jgi:aminoglycoside phosphotransferase family enzyme/predicted kinase
MTRPTLIEALQEPGRFDHPVERLELLETHISWVLLTGPYAYKIKKPVDLGFLDFSTLARRRHFCDEELRLNRRLAPRLYRDVVPITGSPSEPRVGGSGEPIEYAVRMVQFPQAALLDRVLAAGDLSPARVDAMARAIADFHAGAAVASPEQPYGEPDLVFQPVRENFIQVDPLVEAPVERARLERLRDWSINRYQELQDILRKRKDDGWIRECHGDLHLGNMLLDGDAVTAFDCLEFSPALRWIDVQSDLAFLLMDLAEHGADRLARRLLDGYLARTGDYGGLALLPFYRVYRALVRAKVAAIRLAQAGGNSGELHDYLALAERLRRPRQPFLLITHGLSGSGKSHVAGALVERLGAVRLRSDVERKRLLGRDADSATPDADKAAVYGDQLTARTYDRLETLAHTVLDAGTPAIVDATFLKRGQRAAFAALADALRVPFAILDVATPEPVLAERLALRARDGDDPSEADLEVVALQRAAAEPLGDDERARTVLVDGSALDADRLLEQLSRLAIA